MALFKTYKEDALPGSPDAHSMYFLRSEEHTSFRLFVTDADANLLELKNYLFHSGLSEDAGTSEVTNDLITGRPGGQTLIGGTGASENLTIRSTSNNTAGNLNFLGNIKFGIPGSGFTSQTNWIRPSGGGDWFRISTDNNSVSANVLANYMLFFGSEVRFANRLYVGGNAAPTAKLHLSSSGSSAAGTAAFKLTGGTLLASPEAGVIEPNLSGRLFYSPSNNNRRAFVYTDVATPSLGTVPVGNGVDYEIKNGITEVSTTVGVNLSAPGQTTLHIVPASGLNGLIITDVILETTSVAGGASQPPVVAVGTGIAYDSIVEAQATLLVSNSSYSMLRVRLNATIAAPGDGLSIDVMTPSDVIMEATVRLFGYYI